ncbi:hypothetical protein Q5752_004750 [Cryptotrichosporon argae]
MSHTPTQSTPAGNASTAKPSLTGVRIRQRKGQAKAAAKFEPEIFRDSLLLHLALLSTPPTTDELVAKLVQAGATLEFLKYSEQLFELLFVGGLLQPGGSYLDDKRSPVYILQPAEDVEGGGAAGWDSVRGMVEVLKRVIQRYKYLQKPLEDTFLPDLLGYIAKWDPDARHRLAEALAALVHELQVAPKCLQSLTKDHVVKDGVGIAFLTSFFRAYLARVSVDHLAATFRRSGVKDMLAIFPPAQRTRKHLEDHFKAEGLPQIAEWYGKVALNEVKEETIASVERMIADDDSNELIIEHIKTQQAEKPAPDADLVEWIWLAWMRAMDFSIRPDQLDAALVAHITRLAPTVEPFCQSAKAQVGLLNAAQVFCYADTRAMKAFPQIVKVLYNADAVSDQAIIYWHQKGAKPQGKQHFLKVTEPLVKFLEEQDSDDDE